MTQDDEDMILRFFNPVATPVALDLCLLDSHQYIYIYIYLHVYVCVCICFLFPGKIKQKKIKLKGEMGFVQKSDS